MKSIHRLCPLIITTATIAAAAPAGGQESPPDQPIKAEDATSEFEFNFGGGYEFGFGSGIDDDGDVDISRFTSTLNVNWNVNPDFDLSFRVGYLVDFYDFTTESTLAPSEPWDDIHTLALGVIGSYAITDQWTVFGGPIMAFVRESGADWGESFIAGGLVGVTYKLADDLVVGGGFGGTSQIEDDPYFFPLLIVHWQITDELSVGSQTSGALGRTGIELAWKPLEKWEFAIGAANKYSRFRLDDDGIAPDGVGVEDSTPMWLRVGYHVNNHIAIDATCGMTMDGTLRLEDSEGHKISDADFDTAFFLGVFARVSF